MQGTHTKSPAGKPSPKQLRYLNYLAEKTGTSFTYPHTSAEAGREIERLQHLTPESRGDIARQQRETADDMASRRGDAAQVHEHELTGYGSSATWADTWPDDEPRVVHCKRERYDIYVGRGEKGTQQDGEPHALLGYTVAGEHRLIVVQRTGGLVRAEDHPHAGVGKRYLVAEGLKTCGELDSLIADYQSQVARLGAIPAQVEAVDALMDLAL